MKEVGRQLHYNKHNRLFKETKTLLKAKRNEEHRKVEEVIKNERLLESEIVNSYNNKKAKRIIDISKIIKETFTTNEKFRKVLMDEVELALRDIKKGKTGGKDVIPKRPQGRHKLQIKKSVTYDI